MTPNRANLDDLGHNRTYLYLTVILVILSLVGLILFSQLKKTPDTTASIASVPTPTSVPTLAVTDTPTIATSSPSISPTISSTATSPSVTTTPSPKPAKITSTPVPTSTPTIKPTPTPEFQTFTSDVDGFTLSYHSNRKIYQDKESSGNRYTLYLAAGNIAVHVGSQWSWVYPDRQFSSTLQVAGKNTFVYEVTTDTVAAPAQTIIDFQVGTKNYTVQCVHHNQASLKAECQEFLTSFKLN